MFRDADIVKDKETGYLAKPYDFDELAYGINWIISNKMMYEEMRINQKKCFIELGPIKYQGI